MFAVILNMLLAIAVNQENNLVEKKSVEKNGMKVSWEICDDHLCIDMFAATKGWLAIGFNEENSLASTNLLLGTIKEEKLLMSDRYILKPGDHRAVSELGAKSQITNAKGYEDVNGSYISFKIPLKASDQYHKDLSQGTEFFLLMAYSREDDFSHHSMMRTSIHIII